MLSVFGGMLQFIEIWRGVWRRKFAIVSWVFEFGEATKADTSKERHQLEDSKDSRWIRNTFVMVADRF